MPTKKESVSISDKLSQEFKRFREEDAKIKKSSEDKRTAISSELNKTISETTKRMDEYRAKAWAADDALEESVVDLAVSVLNVSEIKNSINDYNRANREYATSLKNINKSASELSQNTKKLFVESKDTLITSVKNKASETKEKAGGLFEILAKSVSGAGVVNAVVELGKSMSSNVSNVLKNSQTSINNANEYKEITSSSNEEQKAEANRSGQRIVGILSHLPAIIKAGIGGYLDNAKIKIEDGRTMRLSSVDAGKDNLNNY